MRRCTGLSVFDHTSFIFPQGFTYESVYLLIHHFAKDERLSQIGELELAIQQLEHQKRELTESLQVCEQQLLELKGHRRSP